VILGRPVKGLNLAELSGFQSGRGGSKEKKSRWVFKKETFIFWAKRELPQKPEPTARKKKPASVKRKDSEGRLNHWKKWKIFIRGREGEAGELSSSGLKLDEALMQEAETEKKGRHGNERRKGRILCCHRKKEKREKLTASTPAPMVVEGTTGNYYPGTWDWEGKEEQKVFATVGGKEQHLMLKGLT